MCGIVGYIGPKKAYPILIKGLTRLEYRGYDSAGVALQNGDLRVFKKKGKVADLVEYAKDKNTSGNIGMGHTRWATHCKPDDTNAHPHTSNSGRVVLIHNGIIENYAVLKSALIRHHYEYKSVHFLGPIYFFVKAVLVLGNSPDKVGQRFALNKCIVVFVAASIVSEI